MSGLPISRRPNSCSSSACCPQAEGGGATDRSFSVLYTMETVTETRNAISSDGSRIVWTASHENVGPLYMRDTAMRKRCASMPPRRLGSYSKRKRGWRSTETQFNIASSDGSMVFFTDRSG